MKISRLTCRQLRWVQSISQLPAHVALFSNNLIILSKMQFLKIVTPYTFSKSLMNRANKKHHIKSLSKIIKGNARNIASTIYLTTFWKALCKYTSYYKQHFGVHTPLTSTKQLSMPHSKKDESIVNRQFPIFERLNIFNPINLISNQILQF